MNNREAVSKITNTLQSLSKDNRISRRYILKVLRDRAKNLIAQKLGERTINNEQNLYTEIRCLELEKIESIDCPIASFRTCRTIMRSKHKLPELIYSRLGASVKEITSIDGDFEFRLVTEEQYRRNKKRKYQLNNEVYVYVGTDEYLYILDHEIYSVDITILTMKTEEVDECSECSKGDCIDNWSLNFIVPDKLEDVVFKEALQIISTKKQLPQDPNPNGIENG